MNKENEFSIKPELTINENNWTTIPEWKDNYAESYFDNASFSKEEIAKHVIQLHKEMSAGIQFFYYCQFCRDDNWFNCIYQSLNTIIYHCYNCNKDSYRITK